MSSTAAHCSYQGCTRPVHAGTGLCIFHAPADKKDPQEFRNALAAQIREWRKPPKAPIWDFSGWVFVDMDRNPKNVQVFQKFNLFRRAVFPVVADFEEAKFETHTCFASSEFIGDAVFEFAHFKGVADFIAAQFMRDVFFESARFTGKAHFWSVQFMGDAYFNSARFTGYAHFESAQFMGEADFRSARFKGGADFRSAHFYKEADFRQVQLHGSLNASYASFAVLGDFSECKILGHVRLLWPGEGRVRIQPTKGEEEKSLTASAEIQRGKLLLKNVDTSRGILDLRGNSLAPDCELVIEGCEMHNVLLEGTDCTKIRFYDCRWPVAPGRQMVGDEWRARPYLKRKRHKRLWRGVRAFFCKRRALLRRFRGWAPKWRLIEMTYQQLAKRFREDFNHPTANDFDCGVFEMRRLSSQQRVSARKFGRLRRLQKGWLSLNALYRYLSNYSAGYIRPVVILAASILTFAWWYRGTTYTSTHRNGLWTFWDYLGLSLQVSYLNRAGLEFARGNSIGVNVLMALQVVFTATLVALFIFAIRRRFRHG